MFERERKKEYELIDQLQPYNILMPKILQKAKEIKSECKDFIITDLPSVNIEVDSNNRITFTDCLGRETFYTTEHSMSQLCNRLDVPYKNFYKKLRCSKRFRQEKIALTKNVIESLSQYCNKGIMIRTYRDWIRAILSDKYSPYDSDQITEVVDASLKCSSIKPSELQIGTYLNSPEQLHLRIIHAVPIKCEKQEIYCGFTFDSSDIGLATISINFYIYESLKSNGIRISVKPGTKNVLFAQRHININDKNIREKIIEACDSFPEIAKNIRSYIDFATETTLKNSGLYSPKSYNGRMMLKELNITNKEIDEFMKYVEKNPKTLWGYITAITDYARERGRQQRWHLEKTAGQILLNPQRYGIMKEEF